MTVKEIVEEWLKKNGYDGLYNERNSCCCTMLDLFMSFKCIVSKIDVNCKAGYFQACPEEHNWYIGKDKPEVKNGRNGETDKED